MRCPNPALVHRWCNARFGWPRDVLGMMQAEGLHWTAFSFHPKATPVVISDWDYSPTPYWGKFVKEALGGRRFEGARMR